MSRDDKTAMALGYEIARMIRDVNEISGNDGGFAHRKVTFPGGATNILVVKRDSDIARIEQMFRLIYDEVNDVTFTPDGKPN